MVRIKEIAKLANVSVSTVSNVLNGRKNVGEATRDKILRIGAELGYDFNKVKKSTESVQSKTVVFIFSDFDREFYLKIINGISDCLTENGYDLIICTNKSSSTFMKSSFASGIISLDGSMTDEAFASVAKPDLPVVLMDRILDHKHVNAKSVIVDNYPAMCELVQTLVDKGFRRFGFLGGLEFTLDNKERYSAFCDTLANNHITFDRRNYFYGNYREESGYQAAKIIILGGDLPEVLVCASDSMALGAIKAFEENGIRVPEDISVTGFDGSDAAAIAELTTISIPRYESGYLAARELLDMIKGTADLGPFKISTELKWRKSAKEQALNKI